MHSDKPIIYYGISRKHEKSFNNFVEMTGEPKLIVEKDENLPQYLGQRLF